MVWHNVVITACIYFIWYYFTILTLFDCTFAIIINKHMILKVQEVIFTCLCVTVFCSIYEMVLLHVQHFCILSGKDSASYISNMYAHMLDIIKVGGWIHNVYISVWVVIYYMAFLLCFCSAFFNHTT